MLQKLNNILNTVISAFVGTFIGYSAYAIYSQNKHPEFSAPWYTSVQVYFYCSIVVIAICLILKFIIKRKIKEAKESEQ